MSYFLTLYWGMIEHMYWYYKVGLAYTFVSSDYVGYSVGYFIWYYLDIPEVENELDRAHYKNYKVRFKVVLKW